jgi:hypothetical protein
VEIPSKPSFNEVIRLVETFFGGRIANMSATRATQEFVFVLYDSFVFLASVDERYGSFGVVHLPAERASVSRFLGTSTTLCTGEAQIREALQTIDDYCRLRLPDKYLEAFDAAVVRSNALDAASNPDE